VQGAVNIIGTIVPIFSVIILGWGARRKGLLPPEFLVAANRLVFYMAIPAMVFLAIARASLTEHLDLHVTAIVMASMVITCAAAWAAAAVVRMDPRQRGAFIEDSFHGNQGYIGLAVALYFLGADGLAQASILTGFMMLLNNFLAVLVLQFHSDSAAGRPDYRVAARKIARNPLILSALGGIVFAAAGFKLPLVFERSLSIVAGMALPLALLIIGASLSFGVLASRLLPVLGACAFKLIGMPALGLVFFLLSGIPARDFLPALILLGTPTATVAYVLARQLGGDAEFCVAAISVSTLLSALTYAAWLALASGL
jgi:predicted permease